MGKFRSYPSLVERQYRSARFVVEELWHRLPKTDLPKLWLPQLIHHVDELPLVGTGKLDLRGVRARALELANAPSEPRMQ